MSHPCVSQLPPSELPAVRGESLTQERSPAHLQDAEEPGTHHRAPAGTWESGAFMKGLTELLLLLLRGCWAGAELLPLETATN